MERGNYVIGLFGRGGTATLPMRRPASVVRLVMHPTEMWVPGWLSALLRERVLAHGDEAVQIFSPGGEALLWIPSTLAVCPPDPSAQASNAQADLFG